MLVDVRVICNEGKAAADEYVIGIRKNIGNMTPIIGPYGVNKEGSGDMYYKGANLIHTIRQLIHDDEKFRQILRGMNETFYHKTVTSAEIENYIAKQSGLKLDKIFDQYLRYAKIPILEYKIKDGILSYRWVTDVKGFDMPVSVILTQGSYTTIKPMNDWKTIPVDATVTAENFKADRLFYIKAQALN